MLEMTVEIQLETRVGKSRRLLKAQWRSLAEFWRRYSKNRAAVLGMSMVLGFIFVAVFAPYLAPYNPFEMHLQDFARI
jgi:peptide/nickel transport system permease protein